MQSKVELANMSFRHIGNGVTISSLTERSEQARAFGAVYDTALRFTLESFDWGFARKVATLALIEEDPTDEWGFSYSLPSDCVAPRKILSGTRVDDASTRIPFELAAEDDDDATILYTDQAEAQLRFTSFVDNVQRYPPSFSMALSYKIAELVAPSIAGSEGFKIARVMDQNFRNHISQAATNANNQEVQEPQADAELISGRD